MAQGKVASAVDKFREQALRCPLPAAVELIGEKWAFLILRGAINELHHFEEFQAGLGIARNILSDRLAKLVAGGILQRTPDPSDRRKVIYSLTAKGEALMPVVLALRQWGEDWETGPADIVLVERSTGRQVRRICIESEDGRVLKKHNDLMWVSRADAEAARKGKAA
ncbi:MAG TPA: helix-turn-helix domain-containing protein [Sphingomicrobium sp.]|nr:helix-turn-helix domain-containing protein [Sphingomicrobium sp.]